MTDPARRGDWMATFTGQRYYPGDPRPEDVRVEDIAHGLAKTCRFGGQCAGFYSVAEHSVLVSYVVPPEHAWQALFHDAPEAYLCDVPRPLKHLLGAAYADLEELSWLAICDALDIDPEMHPSVKAADLAVLMTEKAQLFDPEGPQWSVGVDPADVRIRCLPWSEAYSFWWGRYSDLLAKRMV